MSRKDILIGAVFAAVLAGSLAWQAFADEDSDARKPIVVKTKRSSIAPRALPRLVEIAEAHSPAILTAHAALTTAQLNYEIAARQWYPVLDFKASAGLRGQRPWDGNVPRTPWGSSLDLVASETFYDNGVALANYEIAKDKRERAQIEFEIARDTQLLNIANAWYDWSASLEQREILENNRDMLKRQHNVLEVQYKQGLKTKRDVLRIETEMRRLELDVLNSDNDIDLNFQKLASFTGVSREELRQEEIEGDEAKPFVKFEEQVDELKAKDHRQAKVFSLMEKEATLATRLVERNYWPQITLDGKAGYHNQDYVLNDTLASWDQNQNWNWTTMLTLTYNLWDWGIRDRKLQIARIAESTVATKDQQALLDLGNDLRNVILQLRSFRENVKMTRELLVLEQQSYALLEAEYRNGRAQYLDLILNLKSLIDARSKFIASYYGLRKQQALYSFHQGVLYEKLHQK